MTIPFKVVRDVDVLEEMLDGTFGLTQVGKFITIFPGDEREAVELGSALAHATRHLRGPRVPSDIRLDDEAPVYFRFGPFDARIAIDAMGQELRLVRHPEFGDIVDSTSGGGHPAPKPQFFPQRPPFDHLAFLRNDLLFLKVLQLTAKGGSFLAVKRADPSRRLVVKTAVAHTQATRFGKDAYQALLNEHATLQLLSNCAGVPPAGEVRSDGEVAALIRPFIEGKTLWELVTAANAATDSSRGVMGTLLADVTTQLAEIHNAGYVVRDLAPNNILRTGRHSMILDFDLAYQTEDFDGKPYRRGTLGFYDPSVPRFRTPTLSDDHYALLAMLFMVATGIHPALLPRGIHSWRAREIPGARSRDFREAWCAAYDTHDALESKAAIASAAHSAGLSETPSPAPFAATSQRTIDARINEPLEAFIRLGASGLTSPSLVSIYDGLSGLVIMAAETQADVVDQKVLVAVAETLGSACMRNAARLGHIPGLYFGSPGIGLMLLTLGAILEKREMTKLGLSLFGPDQVHSDIPDICQGIAGFVVAALAGYRVSGEEQLLDAALRGGRRLRELTITSQGGAAWRWPDGLGGSLSGEILFGFAHGIAGVAYALTLLYAELRDETFREMATEATATLEYYARPVPDHEDTLWWPVSTTDTTAWNSWCHGTPGVAKALTKSADVLQDEVAQRLIGQALRGLLCANNFGPSLCHGVASRLDALIDLTRCSSNPLRTLAHSEEMRLRDVLLSLGLHHRAEVKSGHEYFDVDVLRFGLMTGSGGVLRSILRSQGKLAGPFGELLP